MLYFEGDTQSLEDDAKAILALLWNCYPNNPWSVTCKPGIVFIRHLDFPKNWGMALRFTEVAHDAAVMKREIIMKAGEWLERASLKRGAYDSDQDSYSVEGVPEKDHPQPLENMTVTVGKPEPLRESPRPQVLKELAK